MSTNLEKMYKTTMRENSSRKINAKSSTNDGNLLNIIRNEFLTPIKQTVETQCDENLFKLPISSSDRIVFARSIDESSRTTTTSPIVRRDGQIDCEIQVDVRDDSIFSLKNLIEIYSNRLSEETIRQFYEICQEDLIWTRTQLDEYLQHTSIPSKIPTLHQLSFNVLNQWDFHLKSSNPSCSTISIDDLLQDLNDEPVFEEFIDRESENEPNSIRISSMLINSIENLYGEIPQLSSIVAENDFFLLPLDDALSIEIHRALQRFVGVTQKATNEKKIRKSQQTQSQWVAPASKKPNAKSSSSTPSLKEIMDEELNYINTQKPTQKRQLDFASQHKFKQLEQEFSAFSSDVLYEIFRENEFDLDLTRVCLISMLDENAVIHPVVKPISPPQILSSTSNRKEIDPTSAEIYRKHAQEFALKRKDFYTKANQANRHGMTGVASYYIAQARDQTLRMKDANRSAADQLAEQRLNEFRQKHRLDLHEFYADEALALFKRVENDLYDGNRRTTPISIEIITGYGKGSVYGGGCGKIRSVIIAYLKQKKYKFTEPNKGAILVQLSNSR